jgi:hypothetical protein
MLTSEAGSRCYRRTMKRMLIRATGSLTLATLCLVLWAPSAVARGVWDADDARGRLDIRWVGVRYTHDGHAILTVSLYDGFRMSALPRRSTPSLCERRCLRVQLDGAIDGRFFRRHGHIRLSYGDHASACCSIYPVAQGARTLTVRYEPIDEEPPGFRVYGYSKFGQSRDRTARFRLGPPPE